jgi:hypothetical protein
LQNIQKVKKCELIFGDIDYCDSFSIPHYTAEDIKQALIILKYIIMQVETSHGLMQKSSMLIMFGGRMPKNLHGIAK